MYFARIPLLGRLLFRDAVFRVKDKGEKSVYLTFDDGPVPEATLLVLDILKKYETKATFFCVGENVVKHPQVFERIVREGHHVGNHTYNHLNGWKTDDKNYFENIEKCSKTMNSALFRPPYGRIKYSQYCEVKKKYRIILWDVLSRDYDTGLGAGHCLGIVKKKMRAGSIIVFHDSEKAASKIPVLLAGTLDFIKERGFQAKPLSPSF